MRAASENPHGGKVHNLCNEKEHRIGKNRNSSMRNPRHSSTLTFLPKVPSIDFLRHKFMVAIMRYAKKVRRRFEGTETGAGEAIQAEPSRERRRSASRTRCFCDWWYTVRTRAMFFRTNLILASLDAAPPVTCATRSCGCSDARQHKVPNE